MTQNVASDRLPVFEVTGCDTHHQPLMPQRSVLLKWFAVGVLTATALTWAEAQASGGLAGLLRVGTESPVRDIIESELGSIPLTDGFGHDGQFAYAVGLDLSGEHLADSGSELAFRYRRIAYPAVASVLGLFEGYALLHGMVVTTVMSVGLATAFVAWISARSGGSEWIALAVLLNPGVWLTTALLTPDAMALALMMLGLALALAGRGSATSAFAAMVLTKEPFAATAGGLGIGLKPRRFAYIWVPAFVMVVWAAWTSYRIGGGFTSEDNLTYPFGGMIDASSTWFGDYAFNEWFYLAFAMVSLAAGAAAALARPGWLRWPILAWVALGLISAERVWVDGNNAARVFAPMLILVLLHLTQAGRASPAGTRSVRDTTR